VVVLDVLVQETLLIGGVIIAILTDVIQCLLMDTFNMIVHRAGLISGDTEGTLIAANFLIVVTVIHLLWVKVAGFAVSIFCGIAAV